MIQTLHEILWFWNLVLLHAAWTGQTCTVDHVGSQDQLGLVQVADYMDNNHLETANHSTLVSTHSLGSLGYNGGAMGGAMAGGGYIGLTGSSGANTLPHSSHHVTHGSHATLPLSPGGASMHHQQQPSPSPQKCKETPI